MARVIRLLLLGSCYALVTGPLAAAPLTGLVFDDENAIAATHTVPSNPQVNLGVGATISVAADTAITNFALLTFQIAAGSTKFVVYDETTSTFAYQGPAESFSADGFDGQGNANFTFKSSPTFSLSLLGGHDYDLGAIADAETYYAYNLGPTVTQNGITGSPRNVLLQNYADPSIAPNLNTPDKVHGTAEFALQIQNGSAVATPEPSSVSVLGALVAALASATTLRSAARALGARRVSAATNL